jgi:two-component sensor histidine kinase
MNTSTASSFARLDAPTLRGSWKSWLSLDAPEVGPSWLHWVWTLLFSMVIALAFTGMGLLLNLNKLQGWPSLGMLGYWYGKNLIVATTIGLTIQLLFMLLIPLVGGKPVIRRWAGWKRSLFFSGVPLLGVVLSWVPGMWLAGMQGWVRLGDPQARMVVGVSVLVSLALTLAFHHWFGLQARRIDAEKRATEAQLRLLQGQIEPHFLFNTLANVHSLIDYDAPKAKAMLGAFTSYLRASLGGLRRELGPLSDELALAEAYLQVLQTRMEERLRYEIVADEAARQVPLPPMLLQPLVENAVHHGLEPKVEGGCVRIRAQVLADRLQLTVSDDGVGPGGSRRGGNGMALENLRQRLQTHYGDAAQLVMRAAEPGCEVQLSLPLAH